MNYFDIKAVNWSSLKWMRESPMHYRHYLATPQEDKAVFAFGRAVHTLVFEPEKFGAEYAIWEGGTRRGKEWDAFVEAHAGQTILREQDVDQVTELSEAIRRNPLVQPYLDGGEFERAITWTDHDTGLPCKARVDWIVPSRRVLLDLKTCVCAEGRRFGAASARYGYHCQLAHYRNACEYGLGWAPAKVVLVAAEKDAPHDVSVFELDPEALYFGQEEVAELLRKVKVCRETNVWPGRYTSEQCLQLPAWVSMEDEEGTEAFGLTIGE